MPKISYHNIQANAGGAVANAKAFGSGPAIAKAYGGHARVNYLAYKQRRARRRRGCGHRLLPCVPCVPAYCAPRFVTTRPLTMMGGFGGGIVTTRQLTMVGGGGGVSFWTTRPMTMGGF